MIETYIFLEREVVEVFVTAKDLSIPLSQIRDRLKASDLDEWSLQALLQITIDAIGDKGMKE
jgi:hypothetical protein